MNNFIDQIRVNWAMGGARRLIIGIFGAVVGCCVLSSCIGILGGGNRPSATPTAAVAARATDAPKPVAVAPTVDVQATVNAAVVATNAAKPVASPTQTNTPMPTNTPLPTVIPETATAQAVGATRTAQAQATVAVRNAQATAAAFATADAIEMKNATATVVAEKSNWDTIDIRDLVKDPEKYKTKRVAYSGQVFNIEESRGTYTMQIWVTGGNQREAVIVTHAGDSTGIYKDSFVRVYGVVFGAISGKNAFGGTISQPGILAVYVDKQ